MKQPSLDLLRQLKQQLKQAKPPPKPQPAPPSDAELFQREVADVTPLPAPSKVAHDLPQPPPRALQHEQDEHEVMHDAMTDYWPWDELETGEELLYLRPGQRLDTLKKLRRGHWVVQAQLDLHGMNSDQARLAVGVFVHECRRQNRCCVRIIHGKGRGSFNKEPVLKNKLRNWLTQRDEVLAFCQARPVDGGAGAVIALLKGPAR
ncbi:Smr/MutS family protein [Parachitinimonas caeni]|uniref:Smr/MutS family protein n=1 Tax=Parachitinimonas caeni TaxID=3031301 RepID=A0ABT7DX15_9NEIS|nr:Smr/MutS family protein [Parachitinimonas caeni]MDK2124607.1 Smr/MutS family protein [Parachitinimonas caeni]